MNRFALAHSSDSAYHADMKGKVTVFSSFEEAAKEDVAYYRSLSPEERLDILLDLIRQGQPANEAEPRLERIHRIVELARS